MMIHLIFFLSFFFGGGKFGEVVSCRYSGEQWQEKDVASEQENDGFGSFVHMFLWIGRDENTCRLVNHEEMSFGMLRRALSLWKGGGSH